VPNPDGSPTIEEVRAELARRRAGGQPRQRSGPTLEQVRAERERRRVSQLTGPERARENRPEGYAERRGLGATYLHGATIGTGDEIYGAAGALTEGVASFVDPSRNERVHGGELTPYNAEQVSRIAETGIQPSAVSRFMEMPREGVERDRRRNPVRPPPPPPPAPTLQRRLGAAAEGAHRGFEQNQNQFLDYYHQFQAERPGAAAATEITGGILSPVGGLRVGRLGSRLPVIGGAGFREAARTGAIYGAGYGVATGEDWDPSNPEGRINPERLLTYGGQGAGSGVVLRVVGGAVGAVGEGALNIGTRFGLNPEGRATRLIARAINRQQAGEDDLVRRGDTLRRERLREIQRRTGRRANAQERQAIQQELEAQGLTRATARQLVESGRAPFLNVEDVAARARYVRGRNRGTRENPAPMAMMNYEMMGAQGESMANATANAAGPGRDIAARAYARRSTGVDNSGQVFETPAAQRAAARVSDDTGNPSTVSERMLSASRRSLNTEETRVPQTWDEYLEGLQGIRAREARAGYAAGLARDPDARIVEQQLAPLIRSMPRQARVAAARSGADQLEFEVGRLRTEMAQATDAAERAAFAQQITRAEEGVRQLRAIASARGQAPVRNNMWALDYYQRGLHQVESTLVRGSPEASSIAGARRLYNDTLRPMNQPWAEAHQNYGASMRQQDYATQAQNLLRSPERLDDVMTLLRGNLSKHERDAIVVGVLRALDAKLAQGDTRFVAQVMRRRDWQAALRQVMGEEAWAQWNYTALTEQVMRRSESAVLAGSKTARTQEDIRDLTNETELGFMREAMQSGNIRGAFMRRLLDAWDRWAQGGIRNPEVNRALANRLFQTATEGNQARLVDEINNLPWYARANRLGETTANAAGQVGAIGGPMMLNQQQEQQRPRRLGGSTRAPQSAPQYGERPIDMNRPILQNGDGTFSTEQTITIGADGRFFNIPTIVNGQRLSEDQAIALWRAGQNDAVGEFATEDEALASARARTERIGRLRAPLEERAASYSDAELERIASGGN